MWRIRLEKMNKSDAFSSISDCQDKETKNLEPKIIKEVQN